MGPTNQEFEIARHASAGCPSCSEGVSRTVIIQEFINTRFWDLPCA